MTYNAAERAHVRRAEKDAKIAERQRLEIVSYIMSTAASRAWMLSLLEDCHIFITSFTTNALQTAFKEGERNVGLKLLLDVMSAAPDQYITMMREKNERDLSRDAARTNLNGRDQGPSEAGYPGGDLDSETGDGASEA